MFVQYTTAFMDHDIDEQVLRSPFFTIDALEKIGIQSLGHRIRIILAVREINDFAENQRISSESTTSEKEAYIEVNSLSDIAIRRSQLSPYYSYFIAEKKKNLFDTRGIPFNLMPGNNMNFCIYPVVLSITWKRAIKSVRDWSTYSL